MGSVYSIFGAISYIMALNIRGNFQGHSSKASYFSKVGPGLCVAWLLADMHKVLYLAMYISVLKLAITEPFVVCFTQCIQIVTDEPFEIGIAIFHSV